jgi:DNA-binding NarL/FixJ family response regulator
MATATKPRRKGGRPPSLRGYTGARNLVRNRKIKAAFKRGDSPRQIASRHGLSEETVKWINRYAVT